MRRLLPTALMLTLAATALAPAHAHKPSDSYLRLSVAGDAVIGRWDIAVRDLHELLELDADGDGAITWDELRISRPAIVDTAAGALQIRGNGDSCALSFGPLRVIEHSDGPYAALELQAQCPDPRLTRLRIDYALLFALDASHRGLLNLQFGGTHSAVFSAEARSRAFDRALAGKGALFLGYLRDGAWQLWAASPSYRTSQASG